MKTSLHVAGQTLNIDGKFVRCPSAPLFYVKANGRVIDVCETHWLAQKTFGQCCSSDREIWELTAEGHWKLRRRTLAGREQGVLK